MKIPEECKSWFCLLACILHPEKCPEYYLGLLGIYEGQDIERLQREHEKYILWYNEEKEVL